MTRCKECLHQTRNIKRSNLYIHDLVDYPACSLSRIDLCSYLIKVMTKEDVYDTSM